MRYANRITGNHAMATMATFIQLLPKGFKTAAYRSTDATVCVSIEGRGRTHIGDEFVVEWGKRDIFVIPS
jgi:gentisate 1,2-dioxygenase